MTVTSPQLGRPVGANGEETRRRIITAAMRCVAEIGYSQATIREIARAADMTSGSLYHYFPNKSELLKATVSAIEDIVLPRLREAAQRGGDVVDRLDAVLDESDRLMHEYPYLAAFERAVRAEKAAYLVADSTRHDAFKTLRDIISDIVKDADRQGALAAETNAQGAVDVIYALIRGLTEQAANMPPDAYHTALRSAKQLIRGTLFNRRPVTTETQRSGIDLTHVDAEVRPQDDLFGHVNGRWLTHSTIPADRATDGAFRLLYDRAEEQVRELITGAATAATSGTGAATAATSGTDEQRIGDLYASFLDEETIESRGLQPLLDELADIEAASDQSALAALLGRLQRTGVGGGVGLYIDTDSRNSSRYLVHLTQSGLGLPDESYYRDDQHAAILGAYPAHIATMFACVFGGTADQYADRAGRIVALEAGLAGAHWDVVRRRDAELTYNLRAFTDLAAHAPGFDWAGWAGALGLTGTGDAEVVVRQPDYLSAFAALWSEADIADWKDWARWRLIRSRAAVLTPALVEEEFAFYGRTLSGTEEIRDRWKRAVSLVESLMGDAVGRLYVQRHFPVGAKARMDSLVANLLEAYRVSITDLEWMTPATRARALAKLDTFTPKIGYPTKWRDYSALEIRRDDLYGNVIRGAEASFDREQAKLGGPVDREEWFMTPQTVNAYYNPGMNEIVFPAAILQPPFFDAEADDAANYGGIGAVIGHEIGHGFDDQGSKYDGDGNLVDWWTDADRAEFTVRTTTLIEQYDSFVPRDLEDRDEPPHVQGAFTVGENIGDLGGLSIALLAYRLSLGGKEALVIDGLTGVQRVLFGWAQVWRTKSRAAETIRRLAVDPHSPPEFRCNGVLRNIDEFYEAFGVSEDDALYLEPDQRVRIWS